MLKRCLAALAFALAAPAFAQAPAPQTFSGVYGVSLRGIAVGEATYSVSIAGGQYQASFTQRATGLARQAVSDRQDYQASARGVVNAQGLRPFTYSHQGGRRNRLVRVTFSANDAVTTATPPFGSMGNPPATAQQKAGSLDNLSAFISMVLGPGVADPCNRTIRVFDGRARFDFVMAPNGTQNVNTRAFRGTASRCRVEYRPIAGLTDDPAVEGAMTFLFGRLDNGMYLPVRVEFPTESGVAVLQVRSVATTGPRLSWR